LGQVTVVPQLLTALPQTWFAHGSSGVQPQTPAPEQV
jgi:hypothetical protein